MNSNRDKPTLMSLKAAWRQHTSRQPVLDELWLRRAINRAVLTPPVRELKSEFQVALGVALSAAVSVLIFLSSNTVVQSRYTNPSALNFLINGTDYALFDREGQ